MDVVALPVPGASGHASEGRAWHAVLRCLHFLTCRICDPPPEVPDTARLALAVVTFGASASLLAAALNSHALILAYCSLGLARMLPPRSQSVAVMGGVLGVVWLSFFLMPGFVAIGAPAALAGISELCWLMTMRKVLDEEFDVFVAVLFLFLGVQLTFGFYPLLMHWGPMFLQSKEVHQTVQVVVAHAAQVGQHSDSGPAQPSGLSGNGVATGPAGHPENMGPIIVFSQLLPLLLLLLGVPAVAFAVLVSCWMFEHMSRMVMAVALAFVSWMALYATLTFLHVPVSRDLIGKAILASACVLMYHAFSRLTCIDWRAAQTRMLWLGGSFLLVFTLDQLLPMVGHSCLWLLFGVLVGCKLAYLAWANFLEAEQDGSFRVKHLMPFRVVAEHAPEPIAGSADQRGGDPLLREVRARPAPAEPPHVNYI